MKLSIRSIAFAGALLASLFALAADLTLIELRHRTAEELLPVLRPLVKPDAALSGVDYKLLVRVGAEDLARIREALAVLDRAPRQLLISVRYAGASTNSTDDAGVRAQLGSPGAQVAVRGGTTVRSASDGNTSSVRVLEGASAHIATGASVPIVTAFVTPLGRGGVSTDYRELTSGFTVRPRLNGDTVLLEIASQHYAAPTSGVAPVQRASTTISGRLGQWIELGGVTTNETNRNTGVQIAGGARQTSRQSDARSVAVKVELAE